MSESGSCALKTCCAFFFLYARWGLVSVFEKTSHCGANGEKHGTPRKATRVESKSGESNPRRMSLPIMEACCLQPLSTSPSSPADLHRRLRSDRPRVGSPLPRPPLRPPRSVRLFPARAKVFSCFSSAKNRGVAQLGRRAPARYRDPWGCFSTLGCRRRAGQGRANRGKGGLGGDGTGHGSVDVLTVPTRAAWGKRSRARTESHEWKEGVGWESRQRRCRTSAKRDGAKPMFRRQRIAGMRGGLMVRERADRVLGKVGKVGKVIAGQCLGSRGGRRQHTASGFNHLRRWV